MPTINDINQEARDLCDADTSSYPAETLLRRINNAYEKVVGWILQADGTWQYDDTNYSDLPIGTQNLTEGEPKYSFNDKFLQIEEVQVKDNNGNWKILHPIDQREFSDKTPLSEAYENDGLPLYYDKITDDTIKLYPAPTSTNVTLSNGLKIKYRRTADLFTSGDVDAGTKVPGFISTFHYILSYMAAVPYCMTYKKDRVAVYEREIEKFKINLIKAYTARERDKRKRMTTRSRAFK